jgi:hypothetical protein
MGLDENFMPRTIFCVMSLFEKNNKVQFSFHVKLELYSAFTDKVERNCHL